MFAYCGNNPIAFSDPSGEVLISAIIIGVVIGAAAAFGGTVVADYRDDCKVFNGSVSTEQYIAATVIGGTIGGLTGGIASSSFTITLPTGIAHAVTANGVQMLALPTTQVVVSETTIVGAGVAVAGTGIICFSKQNSGRIRFSDGTGINPVTRKPVTDSKRAQDIYRSLDDPTQKANWKKWMKGKGLRTNHLK